MASVAYEGLRHDVGTSLNPLMCVWVLALNELLDQHCHFGVLALDDLLEEMLALGDIHLHL